MLTKTGSLLMRKKQEVLSHNIPINQIQNQHHNQQKKDYKSPSNATHISHVNQYRLLFETNRPKCTNEAPSEISKLLEVQNFRLIEQNMKIVEWSKTFLTNIKQDILRIIHTIQQFKYLQGVNKMYQLLSQINYYEESGLFSVKNIDIKQHYLYTFRHGNTHNPQSKNSIPKNPDNFNIQPAFSVKIPSEIKINEFKIQNEHFNKDIKPMNQIIWSGIGVNNNFLNKMKKQFNDQQQVSDVQDLYHILLMQSLVIESKIAHYY